jgi:glycosyltransferase involved in cell wall biosynthesis
VNFLGMCDSRQVLWASDISVLPSQQGTEAFPLVIIESMLCGVIPIRTPAAGAYDQIKSGVNGYIFPFNDTDKLAENLEILLKDGKLKNLISSEAFRSGQEHFTVDKMLHDTIQVYMNILS